MAEMFGRERTLINVSLNGGYDVVLVGLFPNQLRCPLCKTLMRDPIQTARGQLACESCYTISYVYSNGTCPIDGKPISLEQIFRDKARSLEIGKLHCVCRNTKYGCRWQGNVCDVEDHQSSCNYRPATCAVCNAVINRSTEDHMNVCQELYKPGICFDQDQGCNSKPIDHEDAVKHHQENKVAHIMMPGTAMEGMKYEIDISKQIASQIEKAQEEEQALQVEIHTLTKRVENIASKMSDISLHSKTYRRELSHLADLDLKQLLLEITSYDGRILWKIDKFQTWYQKALTGKVTALHSAPGFTQRYGYKFCARLYLNGDGMGKCTHTSLFFVVMKSEYDNLLDWPFTRSVTFHLINQEDSRKDIKESFLADRDSSSFQKPTKEMNVAAGCPMFVSKEELLNGGFVKDDSIFIEVIVS